MPTVPVLNMDLSEVKNAVWERLQEPRAQRRLVLVIVSIALLLDNMLYMVIVPIIPDYLRRIGVWDTHTEGGRMVSKGATWFVNDTGNYSVPAHMEQVKGMVVYEGEDSAIGFLFASKAMIQLMINPFSGAIIDRIGYDIPMMVGLTIMFFSTAIFACGTSYGLLFFARSLQGVGSAFADTSGLAMIADRFTEENERQQALGIALAFISFGCLVAPPFGGLLYEFAGKEVPFLILAFVCLADGLMLLLVMKPVKQLLKEQSMERKKGTPIWRLLMDPYIAVCAGALMMSNVSLAFLEPTISVWMMDHMDVAEWQMGMIWLPAFFPHVFGVVLTVKMARKYPQYQWVMAAGGLALEGLCCFIVPFSRSYWVLMIPICGICFGIALIDTALLPTLGYLVDVRYVSVYGSIYAIADISYSMAYAIGPIIAGGVVQTIGFVALNIGIALSNLIYTPVLAVLRNIYDYKPFEDEANIIMGDPPDKQYQTYAMHDSSTAGPRPILTELKNHLLYSKLQEEPYADGQATQITETNIDTQLATGSNGYYNQSQEQYATGYNYNQQQQHSQQQQQHEPARPEPPSRPPPPVPLTQQQQQQQPQQDTNPFRQSAGGAVPSGGASASNPFRQGFGY